MLLLGLFLHLRVLGVPRSLHVCGSKLACPNGAGRRQALGSVSPSGKQKQRRSVHPYPLPYELLAALIALLSVAVSALHMVAAFLLEISLLALPTRLHECIGHGFLNGCP